MILSISRPEKNKGRGRCGTFIREHKFNDCCLNKGLNRGPELL